MNTTTALKSAVAPASGRSRQALLHSILTALEARILENGSAGRHLDEAQAEIFEILKQRFESPVAAQAVALKILNLWLAKHHLQARSAHVGSRPFAMYIDPSNSCNLGCPGCVHSTTSKEKHLFDWKPGILSQSRLETLFDSYGPFAAHVGFYNYGDPLVNPLTPKFIKLAKTYLIQTAASTNLSFPKFDAGAYVEAGLDFLTLSIDGATQPVYEKFRRKGKLDVVLENIRRLAEAKRQRGKSTPILSWNFLAFEHNAHEIDTARQLAKSLGVDQFNVFTPFDVSWDDPSIHIANVPAGTEVFNPRTLEAFHENFNPFPDELAAGSIEREFALRWAERLGPDAQLAPKQAQHTCHWLYKTMIMDAGGRILPCCAAPSPQRDLVFSEQGDEGTVPDHYNSPKYEAARLHFADPESNERASAGGETQPHCVKCEWNQTETNFNNQHLQNYFHSAEFHASAGKNNGSKIFDSESLELLCHW